MSKLNIAEPFDENVKAYLRDELERLGLHVETEYETFSHARTVDLVAECQEEDHATLANTLFAYFRTLNIIELKGPNDSLRIQSFHRIMMRGWAADRLSVQSEKEVESEDLDQPDEETDVDESVNFVPANERTITIVSVVRPTKILDTLKDVYRFEKTDEPGIYLWDHIMPVRIIHPDELTIMPKNYSLLCLSRSNKLAAFIEHCMEEGLDEYLQFILTVGSTTDPTLIWNRLMEVQKLKPIIKPETWGYIEDFFREVPEAFESVPIIQKTIFDNIQQAKEEALEEGIEHGLAVGIMQGRKKGVEEGVEQGREEGLESGKLENQQTILIRLLQRKFTNRDKARFNALSQQIRQTDNIETLDQWFDQIFDASVLDDLELSEPTQKTHDLENSEEVPV